MVFPAGSAWSGLQSVCVEHNREPKAPKCGVTLRLSRKGTHVLLTVSKIRQKSASGMYSTQSEVT